MNKFNHNNPPVFIIQLLAYSYEDLELNQGSYSERTQ